MLEVAAEESCDDVHTVQEYTTPATPARRAMRPVREATRRTWLWRMKALSWRVGPTSASTEQSCVAGHAPLRDNEIALAVWREAKGEFWLKACCVTYRHTGPRASPRMRDIVASGFRGRWTDSVVAFVFLVARPFSCNCGSCSVSRAS